ncbi:PH domain-containing protein [Lacibacterium aquatile]|uniref:PH domain-containing protein n=1 Tax=Lacibacterium aquatile TaxID=1168082 RepID=A0ABW5DWN6_9PROT
MIGIYGSFLIFAGSWLFWMIAILRGRPRVTLDTEGVEVAHILKTYRISWQDIRTIMRVEGKTGRHQYFILQKNGSEIRLPSWKHEGEEIYQIVRVAWRKAAPFEELSAKEAEGANG